MNYENQISLIKLQEGLGLVNKEQVDTALEFLKDGFIVINWPINCGTFIMGRKRTKRLYEGRAWTFEATLIDSLSWIEQIDISVFLKRRRV